MKNILIIIGLISIAGISACTKTTEIIYNNGVPGTIIGQVTLYDTLLNFGNRDFIIDDRSGIEVSIEGTQLKGITNKNGSYSIKDVPPGAYILIFKKNDFITYKSDPFEFAGNGTDRFDANI